jgi:hypothetical protein
MKRRDVDNVRETKFLLLRTTPNASSRDDLNVLTQWKPTTCIEL